MKETDLYKPVKDYFNQLGYAVYGEVNNVDVVAKKEKEIIAIELKKSLNLKLILQGMDRQSSFDFVYLCVLKPKFNRRRYFQVKRLLKKLNLGLIYIDKKMNVSIVYEPEKTKKNSKKIIKEIENRSGVIDNKGGTKGKIMTAYKEQCFFIAVTLYFEEILSPKQLLSITGVEKTASILQKNYYNWFTRVKRGYYSLSEEGKNEILESKELFNYYKKRYEDGKECFQKKQEKY